MVRATLPRCQTLLMSSGQQTLFLVPSDSDGLGRVGVHMVAIRATYGQLNAERSEADSMQQVIKYIDDGRLISLERWLSGLCTAI